MFKQQKQVKKRKKNNNYLKAAKYFALALILIILFLTKLKYTFMLPYLNFIAESKVDNQIQEYASNNNSFDEKAIFFSKYLWDYSATSPHNQTDHRIINIWHLMHPEGDSENMRENRSCSISNIFYCKVPITKFKSYTCYRMPFSNNWAWMAAAKCGSCQEVNSYFAHLMKISGTDSRLIKHKGADHLTAEYFNGTEWVALDAWWKHPLNISTPEENLTSVGWDKKYFGNKYQMIAEYQNGTTEDVSKKYLNSLGNLTINCKTKQSFVLKSPINKNIEKVKCKKQWSIVLGANTIGINYSIIHSEENIAVLVEPNKTTEITLS